MAETQHSTPALGANPVRLSDLKINGTSPFSYPEDGVAERLNEAHALLLVVAHGYSVMDTAPHAVSEEFSALRQGIVGEALSGIATLLALAMHQNDAAEAKEASREKA